MTDNFNEAVASLVRDRSKRQALAEMITEYIDPKHVSVDYISMLLNSRSLTAGDSLLKRVRKGVKAYTLVPGSVPMASQITVSERIQYVLDYIVTRVSFSEWDLDNGTIGTADQIRAEMQAVLRDEFQGRLFNALTTVWTAVNTPDNYTSVGGPVTATVLEDAVNRVADVSGGVRAIVGVRSLMNPITKFGALWGNGAVSETIVGIPSQLEAVAQNGVLGKFMGVPLLYVNQIFNNPEDHVAMLPTDKILVIGENAGEFITYGDVKYKEFVDPKPTPSEWVLEYYTSFGLIVDNAESIYVLGNVTA